MEYNRPEAKRLARAAMRGAYPHPMLITLVYLLLTSILTTVIMYFVSNPFSMAWLYMLDGVYDVQTIYQTIFTPGRVGAYLLMELLISLYLWVMQFGYTSYALRLAREEQPGYRNLLDGFSVIGKAILVNLLISIFVGLWSLVGVIPYIILLTVGVFAGSQLLVFLAVLVLIAGVVLAVAMEYRYRLAVYFLLDHPEMGVLESISQSKQAMRGWRWKLFVQDLSFLGWMLLAPFTLGILGLWLTPYMCTAEANFYSWVVYGSFPDPQGPRADSYQSSYQNEDGYHKEDGPSF